LPGRRRGARGRHLRRADREGRRVRGAREAAVGVGGKGTPPPLARMESMSFTEADRERVLRALGADDGTLPELLRYTENPYRARPAGAAARLPLAEEPHVAVWRGYAAVAAELGGGEVLRRRLVQLRFPIREGISADPAYRAATRRGELPETA